MYLSKEVEEVLLKNGNWWLLFTDECVVIVFKIWFQNCMEEIKLKFDI